MKVGIFTECYKPILNGVVNSILGFKQGLENLNYEVYIFCPTYKNNKPEKNVIYCKSWPIPGKSGYHYIFALDKNVKNIASKMDIIHVQHPFIMGSRALGIAKEFSIPIIFTNHTQYDQYAHYIPLSKTFVIQNIINYIKKFSNQVDLIIAPAVGIEKKLKSYGIKTSIEIVPNGIDTSRFKEKVSEKKLDDIRKKYGFSKSDIILVYSGRIAEEKNLTFLLKSFQQVVKLISNAKLLLIGGGVEIDKFRKLIAKLDLISKAIITDFVDYKLMQNYLALAKIYLTASKSEVHPLTLLEAMAQGLVPVIVKAPGTGDIVTDSQDGIASKDDINEYAKKIIKMIKNDNLRKKLSIQAKKTAENYSIASSTKKLIKVYDEVINKYRKKK